jgi:glycosyltransferase involved in cell wall biosynthesis
MLKVTHCANNLADRARRGGIQTYVHSLVRRQGEIANGKIIDLFDEVDQSKINFLHIHSPRQLARFSGLCPAAFTLHNHSTYCPSGTKYFSSKKRCCGRPMSYAGCLWGRVIDGCGSYSPQRIHQDIQTSKKELNILKQQNIKVIAISNYSRSQLIRQGLPSNKVITILHGSELPKVPSIPLDINIHNEKSILFVGRIVPNKGLDWLFSALAITSPDITLDIAGEGWFQTELEMLAKKINITRRITWHGWCDKEKLAQLYQRCFAIVFPSLWPEPAGLVTLEAYAHRRPIIASKSGGIPDYIMHEKTGILVPPQDTGYLVEAITTLANNFPMARQMAEKGHAYFLEKFTMTRHVENLNRLYESITQDFKVMS